MRCPLVEKMLTPASADAILCEGGALYKGYSCGQISVRVVQDLHICVGEHCNKTNLKWKYFIFILHYD